MWLRSLGNTYFKTNLSDNSNVRNGATAAFATGELGHEDDKAVI
jgi:hypothetical protein